LEQLTADCLFSASPNFITSKLLNFSSNSSHPSCSTAESSVSFMTGINPHVFFVIQVVADVVLCLAVVFIIARVNQDLKKRKSFVKTMAELKRLIEESQKATAGLLEAMEESKKALRDVSLSIDEKEARLNRLIEQASSHIDKLDQTSAGLEEAIPEKRTDAVIRLAGQGFTQAEIAESLGISEGEIRLILDLARRRSDSR